MAINKFQRLRLTFDFSAKVAHIGFISTHLNIVFSETSRPFELKFHMKTPCDRLTKNLYQLYWSHDQDGHHAHIW